ncbi:acetyl-CoA synthetase-like protein [Aspergillus steynii IBT 23096]|uniref:Acetyl-CoA synthetase-like protein n=1 Tax=Aspergillus steynii IBT 23096 TaxID=1392250 RepID=A0A2I2GNY4_9EURO|nr:acetyl-CoA synthetase-like protein [Aspergillus steynii IBT 23096]PLB54581.1 acetyl-CoA synthetase-like protein [Aspergillus steynii IBT 23096]
MSHLSQAHVKHLYEQFGELKVLDDIIRHRAADDPPAPILAYPRPNTVADYEYFTGKDLDRLINGAALQYLSLGLNLNEHKVVGLLAPSNIDFIVSFFALSRLGHTVLALSLRIAPVAVVNLLKQTACSTIVHGDTTQIRSTLQSLDADFPISTYTLPLRSEYDQPSRRPEERLVRHIDREKENTEIALIMHSSGSTGLPKAVMLTHRALLTHPTQGSGLHNFNALPWYHLYGVSTSLQAMWMRRTAHLYNAAMPITSDALIQILEIVKPEAVHTVPYVLGLMAEKPRGVELLRRCQVVTGAGARTPDELGDRLVREGVNLGIVFGTTEAGLAGDTMRRAKGDDSWNFIRIYANIRDNVVMKDIGDGLYECVYLKGHPALSTSNSDDPAPGSWHSKDVFMPHASIPDVWKYVTRIDDRITLVNGEKVLPLPIEGRIREDELVREAVVVGVDRTIPGLLVFRAPAGDDMPEDDYLDAIWPAIADANTRAEGFSQITREMVALIPSNVAYPQTDKRSIIRAQVYRQFAEQIESMYTRLDGEQEGLLLLDLPGLEACLQTIFHDIVGVAVESLETDLFTAGVDSLKAIQMRRVIQKTIALNGHTLPQNIVYTKGNIRRLAGYLHALVNQTEKVVDDKETSVATLIERYSRFQEHKYLNGVTNGHGHNDQRNAVILTGATGSIGAHLLHQLLTLETIDIIYCFCRGKNPILRVLRSLEARGLTLPRHPTRTAQIIALTTDLDQPDFGLDQDTLRQLRRDVSLIIHSAWPVNFNIPLSSFEPHVAGLHHLLQFSLSVHQHNPAQLFFCSSISAAWNAPVTTRSIPETALEDLSFAAGMGYAQSKLVGEHIVRNAARQGARSYVLRIGQVVGDTDKGIWNAGESIPLMIQSAQSMKMLPDLNETCSWLPVDILATAILEIATTCGRGPPPRKTNAAHPAVFYNLVNPSEFEWLDVLSQLRRAGLEFGIVPFSQWLDALRDSAARGEEEQNPAIKLVEYYEETYAAGRRGKQARFEVDYARRDSEVMRGACDVLGMGLVEKFWEVWRREK